MNEIKTHRDAELLYEIGTLRHVQRTWRQFGGINFANVAEHTMRVAWIALVIAAREGGADPGKVVQLALIHDMPEVRTGDVHYVSRLYTEVHETKALHDSLSGTSVEALRTLWEEYELQQSLEAKIVKDADTLDVDFELSEREAEGSRLPGRFRPIRDRLSEKLRTRSAREIYTELRSTDPHSWHVNGENRATVGDWKEIMAMSTEG